MEQTRLVNFQIIYSSTTYSYSFFLFVCSVPIHDAIAPAYLDSHFELPLSDIDTPKVPCVQKLLFSATLTKNPAKIAGLHLTNPQYVAVRSGGQIGKDDDGAGEKYTTPETLRVRLVFVCHIWSDSSKLTISPVHRNT